jgi:hypothetical protein
MSGHNCSPNVKIATAQSTHLQHIEPINRFTPALRNVNSIIFCAPLLCTTVHIRTRYQQSFKAITATTLNHFLT